VSGALFAILGQSNALGVATAEACDEHPLGVRQWNQAGALAAATVPLDHAGKISGRFGFDVGFARSFADPNRLVFVPSAIDASGFSNNVWRRGDPGYEAAIARFAAARTAIGGLTERGVLFQFGEADSLADHATFQIDLDRMIDDMRSDLDDPTLPFVFGGMAQAAIAKIGNNAREIQSILRAVSARKSFAAFADSERPTVLGVIGGGDDLHFNADATRTLGERYYRAFVACVKRVPIFQ